MPLFFHYTFTIQESGKYPSLLTLLLILWWLFTNSLMPQARDTLLVILTIWTIWVYNFDHLVYA